MSEQPTSPSAAASDITPEVGLAALQRLRPRIEAVSRERALLPSLDLRAVAVFVVGVAERIREPGLYRRFTSLPANEFDPGHLDDLLPLGQALGYAQRELGSARATSTTAKLPVDLVEQATAVKERMLKVTGYQLEDTEDEDEVADIRQGSGYLDLMSDLGRLAKLYEKYPEVVARDAKNYRAGDLNDARQLGLRISQELGQGQTADAAARSLQLGRVWVLVEQVYDEVAVTGRWLLRHEGGEAIFRSLYAVGRQGVGRKRRRTQDSGSGGGETGGGSTG